MLPTLLVLAAVDGICLLSALVLLLLQPGAPASERFSIGAASKAAAVSQQVFLHASADATSDGECSALA